MLPAASIETSLDRQALLLRIAPEGGLITFFVSLAHVLSRNSLLWCPVTFWLLLSAWQLLLSVCGFLVVAHLGDIEDSVRNGIKTPASIGLSILSGIKRLQGFGDNHFCYEHMGFSFWGYVVVILSSFHALVLHIERAPSLLFVVASVFTLCLYWSPCYPLMLTYANGFGWNVYYRGTFANRSFNGERFFAVDWHEEKLPERGPDGLWMPRSRMRTVYWPHVHMCWLRLEFWPWFWVPSMPDDGELAELRKQREQTKQRRAAKKDASAAPKVLEQDVLFAALNAAVMQAGGKTALQSLFEKGSTLDVVAADLVAAVEKKLVESGAVHRNLPSDPLPEAVCSDVRKSCKRMAGCVFAQFRKSASQKAKV
eukprot:TRINITY_DN34992_c0_g1_i1.p1 TRINITY_DN34992_c0_g1~~TRINITY_DN34992_c0_g1_i1.p1  ORF type:complete len:376 (-),score=68.21 TRINITY_DN34992_c0_g1_i1:27-1130(-)